MTLCPRHLVLLLLVAFSWGTSPLAVASRRPSSRDAAGAAGTPECGQPLEEVVVGGGVSLTLTSPNFPAAYDYRTKCGWTFRPSSRNVVVVMSCDTFDLQPPSSAGECSDFVKVQGVKYCGNNIPLSITITNITRFKVIFKTNGQQNYKGFHCNIRTTNPNTDHCLCGVRGQSQSPPTEERVSRGEFPWLAALVKAKTSTPFCGASVVNEKWVLTSASCVERIKYNKYNYEVIVGGHNLDVARSGQARLSIRKVFIHPRYIPGETLIENNAALVQLKDAIRFKSTSGGSVREGPLPVCLPDHNTHTDYTSHKAILTGWGSEEGTSGVAGKVVVRTLSRSRCAQLYDGHGLRISVSSLCATPVNITQRDFCQVDLGGPLVIEKEGGEGRYLQVGLASYSTDCSQNHHQTPRLPGVYTDLAPYLRWIMNTVGVDNTFH